MSKRYDVTALGEILIDFTPMGKDADGDDTFARKAGGAPLNLLATVAKFGGRTAFLGKVGDDMFGRFLRATVESCGVDAAGLITDPDHNTTMAFVRLDEHGDRDFTFCRRHGADTFLSADEVRVDRIRDSRIFHFGSLSFTSPVSAAATERALEEARAAGCIISYDPNYRPPLWESYEAAVAVMRRNITSVDVTKVSREELAMIAGTEDVEEGMDALHAAGVKLVVMTDGAAPVLTSCRGVRGVCVPEPVQAVDTTGAGDIFFGSFLSRLLQSGKTPESVTPEEVASFVSDANRIAGQSTLAHGAIASIPEIPAAFRLSESK